MNTGNVIFDYLMQVITLKNVIIFSVLYFFVIWISLLAWVIKDITNRTDKLYLQILSILIILLFTPFGIFLYLLIRPGKTLFEQYYTEVENNLECLSEDVVEKIGKKNFNTIKCSKCNSEIQEEFKYCPYCKTKINFIENPLKEPKSNKKEIKKSKKSKKKEKNT